MIKAMFEAPATYLQQHQAERRQEMTKREVDRCIGEMAGVLGSPDISSLPDREREWDFSHPTNEGGVT